jgi:hypothetical protein
MGHWIKPQNDYAHFFQVKLNHDHSNKEPKWTLKDLANHLAVGVNCMSPLTRYLPLPKPFKERDGRRPPLFNKSELLNWHKEVLILQKNSKEEK